MQRCPSCGEPNHPTADRCAKCGAWFPRGADGAPAPAVPPSQPAARELPPADTLEGRVLRLLEQGQKIEAIKMYREATGAGLKEAKDAVEAMGRRHGLNVRASGCGSAALVACILVALCVAGTFQLIFGS